VRYFGRGLMKMILKPKMNIVDIGIVARHIVTTLEHEGKMITAVTVKTVNKPPEIEIKFQ